MIRVTEIKVQWLDLDRPFSVDGDIPDSVLQNTTDDTKPSFTGDAFWTEYVDIYGYNGNASLLLANVYLKCERDNGLYAWSTG